jgi:hypothetical protein
MRSVSQSHCHSLVFEPFASLRHASHIAMPFLNARVLHVRGLPPAKPAWCRGPCESEESGNLLGSSASRARQDPQEPRNSARSRAGEYGFASRRVRIREQASADSRAGECGFASRRVRIRPPARQDPLGVGSEGLRQRNLVKWTQRFGQMEFDQ